MKGRRPNERITTRSALYGVSTRPTPQAVESWTSGYVRSPPLSRHWSSIARLLSAQIVHSLVYRGAQTTQNLHLGYFDNSRIVKTPARR